MDEMDLVRQLRPERELPGTTALLPARSVLLAAIDAEQSTPAARPKARRRVLLGLAVAAAVAAGLVVVPWHGSDGPSDAADPVTVLNQAAQYAATQPFTPPRPDQFLFMAPDSWYSIDDTHDGRAGEETLPGCRDGRRPVLYGNNPQPGQTEPCTPRPVYLADAPTTVPAMRGYLLRRVAAGSADDVPNRLMGALTSIYLFDVLSPAATATLFRTVTTLPGLRVVADARTIGGEHGVGVTLTGKDGTSETLIFDRHTHRFLGATTRGLKGELGGSEVVARAVVDRVGELPR